VHPTRENTRIDEARQAIAEAVVKPSMGAKSQNKRRTPETGNQEQVAKKMDEQV